MRLRWMAGPALATLALALAVYASAEAEAGPRQVANDTCLACHGRPGLQLTLGDGETVSLGIDRAAYSASVHGEMQLRCVDCHTDISAYPHPAATAADRRDLSLQLSQTCQTCHADQYERTLDSVHDRARAGGSREAAICTDCHGAHDTRRLTEPSSGTLLRDARAWIPQTCAHCHSAIYEKYLTSVHGSALLDESNPDVPTCIDCHGVHNIEDPTTAAFRLASPTLCANCHTDPERMGRYGLSTQVLNTYVADFHGTTVTLFERLSPDAPTNKPVCFDCHGVHDIQRTDDPERGLQLRENLLARCQRCHPDAGADFPSAWLSHYIPSPDHYALVYTVNLFYKLFIPGTLGGMAVLVALDLSHRIRSRRRGPSAVAAPPPAGEPSPTAGPPGESVPPAPAVSAPAPQGPSSDGPHLEAADDQGQEEAHD